MKTENRNLTISKIELYLSENDGNHKIFHIKNR